jgi:hypothetical protein
MQYLLTGTGIGFPVTVLCMTLVGGFNQATRELMIWLLASTLFGLTSGLFYQKLNLNLLAATALHAVCCLGIASTAGWLCGYADSFLELVKAILPVFVLIYTFVYLGVFFSMTREAKQINDSLEKE